MHTEHARRSATLPASAGTGLLLNLQQRTKKIVMTMQELSQTNIETMAAIAIRYELQALEEFVKHRCQPEPAKQTTPAMRPGKWEQFIDSELKKIRSNMTAQVLSIAKPRHVELYIQHHQAGMLRLSAAVRELEQGNRDTGNQKVWQQLYSSLQERLMELLDFLKHYFEPYFDWHQVIPVCRRSGMLAIKFSRYLKVLDQYGNTECAPVLAMIRSYCTPVARKTDTQLTFYEDQYFDLLFDALSRQPRERHTLTDLVELLLQLNYNESQFMDYCRMKIIAGLACQETVNCKLQFLAERIKQLKQLPLQKTPAFCPANPGIAGYCRQWMEEEYQFLQYSDQLWTGATQPAADLHSGLRLQTRLPVSQVGIFLHLIYCTGLMKHKNKTAFINFFARHLVRPDSEAISEKNLRNSYYNMDSKAREQVKDLLYEMLKILRQTEQI